MIDFISLFILLYVGIGLSWAGVYGDKNFTATGFEVAGAGVFWPLFLIRGIFRVLIGGINAFRSS